MSPDDPRHGTNAGAHAHRTAGTPACGPCVAAATAYTKRHRLDTHRGAPSRLVPAVGTRRRVQALARIGWSLGEQAARLGITQQALAYSVSTDRAQVSRARHDAVVALYTALQDRVGTSATGAARAAHKGWPAPACWDNPDDPDERPSGAMGTVRVRQPNALTVKGRRDAHAAYVRGDRTPEVVTGEREYQRLRPDRLRRRAA